MVPLLCLLIFLGERFAFLFGLWGLLARNAGRPLTEAVPPCHFMTFPPPRGGIFLLSLRDISPTLWGNLPTPQPHREYSVQFTAVLIFAICVQAQPALLKKAGENFNLGSSYLCRPARVL